jgi:glycosyltransferase involved in cell wall biosynthesis
MKVLICGTHPTQYNGYSKVVYELSRELAKFQDISVMIYGFQNYYDSKEHQQERKLPQNVEIYDAFKNENPQKRGFGEDQIKDFVLEKKPDVVMVYNDLAVLSTFLERLNEIPDRQFKIIPYIDLVYRNQRTALLKHIESKCDGAFMFTKYWENIAKYQGFSKPTYVLEHGFNPATIYPIPKLVARKYFGISEKEFIISNLNRNQPRKRWDLCIMAFVEFISRHLGENVKLLIATAVKGSWDLLEIFVSECQKYNLDPNVAKQHLIIVQNPQQMTDREVNILYNIADIGINTCEGEGFGLCNFEQAAIGIPQICPAIGGFKDFFDKDTALLVQPKYSYYLDSSHDIVGGEPQICDTQDYTNALELYYADADLRAEHGKNARNKIIANYKWPVLASRVRSVLLEIIPPVFQQNDDLTNLMPSLNKEPNVDVKNFNAKPPAIFKSMEVVENKKTPFEEVAQNRTLPVQAPEPPKEATKDATKDATKEAEEEEDEDDDIDFEMLAKLNKKISRLLSKQSKK